MTQGPRAPRPVRRAVCDRVQAAATGTWCAAFGLARRWRPHKVSTWQNAANDPEPARGPVLVVAPHPDDETAGCAGTVLRHVAAGDPVTVATMTDGRASRAYGLDPATMATTRQAEAEAAAAVLGTRLVWCGLREGVWQRHDGADALRAIVDAVQPQVLYAPSRLDFHPEHRAVAAVVASVLSAMRTALRTQDHLPTLRIYPIQVPLDGTVVNRVVAVGPHESAIRRAIAAHHSQAGTLIGSLRRRRYTAARFGVEHLAEAFWTMTAADYVRLHQTEGHQTEERQSLYGLRYLAVTDPWVYWRNRAAFRRAQAEICS